MDVPDSADHVMDDVDQHNLVTANGIVPETLDPSLLLSTHDEPMPSPDILREAPTISNGLHLPKTNGSQTSDSDDVPGSIARKETSIAPRFSPLPYASSRSGLVYDVRMRFHVEPIPKDSDMHPEDPRRIYEIYQELCQAGLVDDPANPDLVGQYPLLRIPARHATEDEILACHSKDSFDFVMSLKGKSPRANDNEGR